MMTLTQAREEALKLSRTTANPVHINRYYYHNPNTKEIELRYILDSTTTRSKRVETYMSGSKVE